MQLDEEDVMAIVEALEADGKPIQELSKDLLKDQSGALIFEMIKAPLVALLEGFAAWQRGQAPFLVLALLVFCGYCGWLEVRQWLNF